MRERTTGNQAGDAFAGIREQDVRAVCTQAMRHLITFDAADGEDAALLYFAQECSLFAQRSGYGNTQYDFIHIFRQLGGSSIQIKFNLWLPVFLENMWRIWCFVGDVFGVNALDLESHLGVVLF